MILDSNAIFAPLHFVIPELVAALFVLCVMQERGVEMEMKINMKMELELASWTRMRCDEEVLKGMAQSTNIYHVCISSQRGLFTH